MLYSTLTGGWGNDWRLNDVVLSPSTRPHMGRCPWPALFPPLICPPSDRAGSELLTLWTHPSLGDNDWQVKETVWVNQYFFFFTSQAQSTEILNDILKNDKEYWECVNVMWRFWCSEELRIQFSVQFVDSYKIRPGNIKMFSGYNCHMRGKHLDSVILWANTVKACQGH